MAALDEVAEVAAPCGTESSNDIELAEAANAEAVQVEVLTTPKPVDREELDIINPRTKRPLAPYSQRELYEKKSPPTITRRPHPIPKPKRVSNGTGADSSPSALQHPHAFTPPGPNVHDQCVHRYVPPGPGAGAKTPGDAATSAQQKKATSGRDALRMSREGNPRTCRDAPLRTSREAPLRSSRDRNPGSPGGGRQQPSRSPPPPRASPPPSRSSPPPPQQQPLASKDSYGSGRTSTSSVKPSGVDLVAAPAAVANTLPADAQPAAVAVAAGRSPTVGRSKSAVPKKVDGGSQWSTTPATQAQKPALPAKARSSPLSGARPSIGSGPSGKATLSEQSSVKAGSGPESVGAGAAAATLGKGNDGPAEEPPEPSAPRDGNAADSDESTPAAGAGDAAGADAAAAMAAAAAEDAALDAAAAVAAALDPAAADKQEGQEQQLGGEPDGEAPQRTSAPGSHAATDGAITDSEACAEDAAAGAGGGKGQHGVGGSGDATAAAPEAGGAAASCAADKAASSKALGAAEVKGGRVGELELEEGPAAAGCRCVVM